MSVAIEPRVFSGGQEAAKKSVSAPIQKQSRSWVGWLPLVALPITLIGMRARLLPWVFLWLLAAAIFAGCKWQTWWEARPSLPATINWKPSAAYLLLWPGMDAQEFFAPLAIEQRVLVSEWLAAIAKTLAAIALIWSGAKGIAAGHPLAGGWMGMLGLVLLLHFGAFHLIALAWQRAGVGVRPIMQRPLASRSLSELWGKRWNLGFRKLTHTWVFLPLQKRFGVIPATLASFFASGLLHDIVISVPARGGYGLPTAYFLLQGFGVIAERSQTGKRLGLGRGARGWLWTALVAVGPLYWLFHPWFVMRVIVPFLRAVAG